MVVSKDTGGGGGGIVWLVETIWRDLILAEETKGDIGCVEVLFDIEKLVQ